MQISHETRLHIHPDRQRNCCNGELGHDPCGTDDHSLSARRKCCCGGRVDVRRGHQHEQAETSLVDVTTPPAQGECMPELVHCLHEREANPRQQQVPRATQV